MHNNTDPSSVFILYRHVSKITPRETVNPPNMAAPIGNAIIPEHEIVIILTFLSKGKGACIDSSHKYFMKR